MMPDEPIRGFVAEIINRRELVINVGSEQGVEVGMKFAVLSAKGAEIRDPISEEPLGSIEIPKVLVEVVRVQPRLSVARTFKVRKRTIGQGLGIPLFQP